MWRTRSHAGMGAFPCLLAEQPEEQHDEALPTLMWRILHTQAALARSVALLKAGQNRLDEADEHLLRRPDRLTSHDA